MSLRGLGFIHLINLPLVMIQAYIPVGYIGCFKDDKLSRILPVMVGLFSRHNSGDVCKKHCSSHGYRYAGTEFWVECWCGNYINETLKRKDSECNLWCPGNEAEKCGGNLRLSVYRIKEDYSFINPKTERLSTAHTKTTSTMKPRWTSALYTNSTENNTMTDGTDTSLLPLYIVLPGAIITCVVVMLVLIFRSKCSTFILKKFTRRETGSEPNLYVNSSIIYNEMIGNNTSLQNSLENMTEYMEVELDVNNTGKVMVPVDMAMNMEYDVLNAKPSKNFTQENTYDHTNMNTDGHANMNTYDHTNINTDGHANMNTYDHANMNTDGHEDDAYSKVSDGRINTQQTAELILNRRQN